LRSGETKIPAVRGARDAFFNQHVFVGRGLWDRYLFDGRPETSFFQSPRNNSGLRSPMDALLRLDFGEVIRPTVIELTTPDQYSLGSLLEGEGGSEAQISTDLKNWIAIPFIHGERSRIHLPAGTGVRYVRISRLNCRLSEVNAYAGGRSLPREKWRASNLFGSFARMEFRKAWLGSMRVEQCVRGGYLCIALNGKHGIEGAYAAVRTADGRFIGAADRATSFACNPWEGTCKRDSNYTYYVPLTPDMAGQQLEVVVLANAACDDKLRPEVWQTAHGAPFSEKLLQLQ
jgi:hypothetical protein